MAVSGVVAPHAITGKRTIQELFEAEDYFVLRAPLLPVASWLDGGIFPADRSNALSALRKSWTDLRVREAIYLASPSLFERLTKWDWSINDEKGAKLAQALYRYISRMSTRSTPFGLFASISLGRVGDATGLDVVGPKARLRRHTRLDTASVAALGERLARDPSLNQYLRVRRNDCGHAVGNRWHYVEWELKQGLRLYNLSSVGASEYLSCALKCADGDGCSIHALIDAICAADSEIDRDVASDFVNHLIDSHLLVPTLEPTVTGRECLPALVEELVTLASNARGVAELSVVSEKLRQIDSAGLGRSPDDYSAIAETLVSLDPKLHRDRLFQVDLFRDVEGLQLSRAIVDEIVCAADVYMTLGAQRGGPLDEFCRRFSQRYDDRRVPLLEALDEETGVGISRPGAVPSALLDGVAWNRSVDENADGSRGEALLLARWHEAIAHGIDEVVLEAKDLPDLSDAQRVRVPASISAVATLLASDVKSLEQGDYSILLHGLLGPSTANMLGRFCFGNPALAQCVRESLAREAQTDPDAIFAEIVHLPQERLGNIVCRPLLRDYEIPVLGRSGAPIEKRIGLDDLDIEVHGQRVLLWSRRLGRRVIPRLSNAHNYGANALSIYRFLCEIQHQDGTRARFPWGRQLHSLPRLPRVRYGRVVLAPAQWRIKAENAQPFLDANSEARPAAAEALRLMHGLPRLVGVVEGDDSLAIDFSNPVAIDTLARMLRQKRRLHLTEIAVSPAQLCVGSAEARYAHEIILPLRRQRATKNGHGMVDTRVRELRTRFSQRPAAAYRVVPNAERHRLPGSDWLYYRIYGGANVLDRVLVDTLAPLVEAFRREGAASNWFFVRYADPELHLRLRVHGEPERLLTEVMPRMTLTLEQLCHQGTVARVEIATYDREIERYGGPLGMQLCERWFAQDSRRIAQLLAIIRGHNSQWRWQLAAGCLIRDLRDFGLDSERLRDLFSYAARGFIDEFDMRKERLATVGRKYREHAASIQAICAGELPDLPGRREILAVLDADAQERHSVGEALHKAQMPGGGLWGSADLLLPSLMHMSCNRWFVDNARAHEMVLYELVRRGFDSIQALSVSN